MKDQLGGEIITIFVVLRPKIETKNVRTGCCSVSKVNWGVFLPVNLTCHGAYNHNWEKKCLCWKQQNTGKIRYSTKFMSLYLGYWSVLDFNQEDKLRSPLQNQNFGSTKKKICLSPWDTDVFLCSIYFLPRKMLVYSFILNKLIGRCLHRP